MNDRNKRFYIKLTGKIRTKTYKQHIKPALKDSQNIYRKKIALTN